MPCNRFFRKAARVKRFWDQAKAQETDAGWIVTLDGKPVRLPGAEAQGESFTLPNASLAEAIAAEWQQAGLMSGDMSYDDVPLTRLVGTAQLRVSHAREAVVAEIARYGETDLLCYRADQPRALVQAQQATWQPWLDWAADVLGARLHVTTGIVHVPQDAQALQALTAATAAYDPYHLAALGVLVPSYGSLVLGLAVVRGALSAHEAHEIATLDERHQAEFWGWDSEASARMARIAADVSVAGHLIDLITAV